ncbi:hypothetical protein B0H13DRAFT_1878934 [Mycena leptocephala]|nr:hypothetical protein B0H13DRAFT_1878934 [Mycena leptocephala]
MYCCMHKCRNSSISHKAGSHLAHCNLSGVQFRYGTSLFVAKASKEIILSTGTIGTPQILPGNTDAAGPPERGKNASEHAYSGVSWAVNSNQTVESITQNTTRFNEAFAEWDRSRTGPFVDPSPGTHAGWLRLNADSPVFDGYPGHFISLTVAMVSPSVAFGDPQQHLPARRRGTAIWARRRSTGCDEPAELTAHIRANSGRGITLLGRLPIVPGAHTQAATYVVAERGADMVIGSHARALEAESSVQRWVSKAESKGPKQYNSIRLDVDHRIATVRYSTIILPSFLRITRLRAGELQR